MATRPPQFSPFYLCCGAGLSYGGKRFEYYEGDVERALKNVRKAFILTNKPYKGLREVSPGVYLAEQGEEWSLDRFRSVYKLSPDDRYSNYPYHMGSGLNGKINIVAGFNIRASLNPDKQILSKVVKNKPNFAILADYYQHNAYEEALIRCGFEVVSRRINPNTNNPLTLFMRPKETKVRASA